MQLYCDILPIHENDNVLDVQKQPVGSLEMLSIVLSMTLTIVWRMFGLIILHLTCSKVVTN